MPPRGRLRLAVETGDNGPGNPLPPRPISINRDTLRKGEEVENTNCEPVSRGEYPLFPSPSILPSDEYLYIIEWEGSGMIGPARGVVFSLPNSFFLLDATARWTSFPRRSSNKVSEAYPYRLLGRVPLQAITLTLPENWNKGC